MTPADRYRAVIIEFRAVLIAELLVLKGAEQPSGAFAFWTQLFDDALASVVHDLSAAIDGKCPENPARLAGTAIGQYRCPCCACMVLAGVPLHPHDDGCRLGLNEEN